MERYTYSDSRRVLVVDDDPETRRFLTTVLVEQGHDVREAGNGVDALTIALSWRPDLILLDLLMPAMNGWQFADAYQSLPLRRAPIVAITAAGKPAIESAQALPHVAAVLSKPVQLNELLSFVDLALTFGAAEAA